MKTYRTLIMLLPLFSSCLKRDERHVNVPCTDSCMVFNIRLGTGLNSAAPLANTTVELGWKKSGIFGGSGRLIARGKTAADGSLHCSFKSKPEELESGSYYVSVPGSDVYFQQENSYTGITRYDTVVEAAVHVPSKATVKIVYKNFKPGGKDDFFECSPSFLSYGSAPGPVEMKNTDGSSSNTFFHDSAFTVKELTGITAGDQYTYFTIINRKDGTRIDLRDSIYIGKGTTKTYEITY